MSMCRVLFGLEIENPDDNRRAGTGMADEEA